MHRQRRQVGVALQMLHRQLGRSKAGERRHAGEHFLVNNGQTILITAGARHSLKHFRRRI